MSDEDLDKNLLSAFSNKNASKKPRKRTMKDDDDDEDSYDTSEDIDIEDGAMDDDDDDTDDTDDDRSSAPKKRGPAKKKGRARDFSDDDDDDDDSEDDDDDLDIMEDRASEKRGQKTKGAKAVAGKKAPVAAKKGRQASAAPAKGRGKKAPVPFQSLSLAKDLAFITAEGLKYGIEFESLPYGPDNYIDYNERERLTREMPQIELESMLYERSEEQNQIRIRNDIKFQQLKDLKAKEMAEDKKTTSTEKPRRSTRQTASQKKPRRSLASRKAALSGDESESDSYDDSDGSVSDSASDRDDDSDDYHDRTMDSIDSDLSFGATPAKSSRKAYDPRSATSSSSTSSSQAEKEPVVEEDPTKVTVKDVRKVQILRSDLEYFFDKPNMKEYLQNSYVRLMIGTKKDNEKVYRMCEIIGIRESKDKKYKFFNTETNIYLTLRHARDSKDFSMDVVSNQPITEEEFNRWWSNLGEYDLVTKQTILQKVEELEKFRTEIKEDLNSFQRMTELRCQIKIAVDAENEPEIARLRDLIDALDQKIKQRNLKPKRKLKASSNSNGLSSLDLSQVHASRASADFVVPRSSGPPAHKLFNSNFDFDLRINTDLDHSLLSETEAQKLDRLAKSIKFFDAKRPYNVMSSNEYFDRF